jgi:hypothetical protein
MLRSAAASNGQQVRKRGEHGSSDSEAALLSRGRRFYLPIQSLLQAGGFAYLRIRSDGHPLAVYQHVILGIEVYIDSGANA